MFALKRNAVLNFNPQQVCDIKKKFFCIFCKEKKGLHTPYIMYLRNVDEVGRVYKIYED